jgi:hypothetical protein
MMMIRLVITLGLLLMLAGFGAAGFQYWEKMQKTAETAAPEAEPAAEVVPALPKSQQTWLISPTGGLAPRDDVRAYLAQDRYVKTRAVEITRTALLSDLLLEGETLPEAPYLEVLADIRAPIIGERLCAALSALAADCALHAARVVKGSVDPVAGKARFRFDLVYRLKTSDDDLPDLAAHALNTDKFEINLAEDTEAPRTVEEFTRLAIDSALQSCDAIENAKACRIMKLNITWYESGTGAARAEIGWMSPLPKGILPAPPLG